MKKKKNKAKQEDIVQAVDDMPSENDETQAQPMEVSEVVDRAPSAVNEADQLAELSQV